MVEIVDAQTMTFYGKNVNMCKPLMLLMPLFKRICFLELIIFIELRSVFADRYASYADCFNFYKCL